MSITAAWAECTEDDRLAGAAAYPAYHAGIRQFASFYGVGFVQAVEAFAALSPNNDYHGNLRSLASVLFCVASGTPFERLTVSTYRACATRALSYLTGEVSFLDTVNGRKITAFRHNILYPETSTQVTVDGHMVGLHFGLPITMREAALSLRGDTYDRIEKAVQRIARSEGLPCPQVQATLWMHRKRTLAINHSTQTELFSGLNRWQEIPNPEHYPPFQIGAWRRWLQTSSNLQRVAP